MDEDKVLEALLREEEAAEQLIIAEEEAGPGFSVEDLETFTLADVDTPDDLLDDEDSQEDGEGDAEVDLELLPAVAVLTPDAGKIRFAEDIVDESRGSGRRDRKSRRGSGASRGGARRGGR